MVAPTSMVSPGLRGNWQDLGPLSLQPAQVGPGVNPGARPMDQDIAQYGQPEEKRGSWGGFLLKTVIALGVIYGIAKGGTKFIDPAKEGILSGFRKGCAFVEKWAEKPYNAFKNWRSKS